MLKLLGRASSINVRKVLWTLTEIGCEYQHESWGEGDLSLQSPEFLALNPNAMVPVLCHDDVVLWESNSICRYLANLHPDSGLLPQSPLARAQVEKWMDWQATDLNSAWRYVFMARVRQHPAFQDQGQIEASVANWNRHMQILERQLQATGAFAAGAQFTLADVVLGLSTHRWYSCPMAHADLPAVAAYYQRLSEREGFRKFGRNGGP